MPNHLFTYCPWVDVGLRTGISERNGHNVEVRAWKKERERVETEVDNLGLEK